MTTGISRRLAAIEESATLAITAKAKAWVRFTLEGVPPVVAGSPAELLIATGDE